MMESAETASCLWMITDQKIFGIRIEKLEKLGKNEVRDWKSHLEPAPFDFQLELPENSLLYPFIFDSKLFLLGGPSDSGTRIYQISYVGGDTLDISEAVATGAIPPLPTGHHNYIANIQDDVYLLVHDAPGESRTGLWILRSRSGKWHSLSIPPTALSDLHPSWPWPFVLKDKLFFHSLSAPRIDCAYDPRTATWHKPERAFSFSDRHFHPPLVLVSSLEDVGNCSVVLTWKLECIPKGSRVKYSIHALLVDNQDYRVRRHQVLDELCEAIQPSYFKGTCTEMNLVDLGNSKVCVLIGGLAESIRDPALCILIVELGLVQEEEQRFLSVHVLVNQVYGMLPLPYLEDRRLDVLCTSFLFSLSKGMSDIDRDAVEDHIGEKALTLTSASLANRASGKDDPSTEGDKDDVVEVAQSKEISLKRRKPESAAVGLEKYVEVSQLKDKGRELGMKDMTEALKAKEKESEEMVKQITTLQSQLKGRDEKIEALTLKVGEMFRKGFDRAISQIKALAPEVNVVDMDVSKIVVNGVLVDANIPEEGCDVKENDIKVGAN
ncbi:uncharacterized protein LOC130979946 [Arachis stenosperma]|uniref:uncharacterized protein LOC130979946 n=1 Tax=Arachis stenosperma TaxID=217475 RepID=UPI0025ABF447|nr:uncharacterized protein LOC130979946 [Arachis stenosperma]